MANYNFSAKRKAALKKAQLESARKRRKHGGTTTKTMSNAKKLALVGAVAAATSAAAYGKIKLQNPNHPEDNSDDGKLDLNLPEGEIVKLYHITHQKNVEKILSEGLKGSDYGEGIEGHGKIHLTTNLELMKHFKRRYGTEIIEITAHRNDLMRDLNEPGVPYFTVDPAKVAAFKYGGSLG